MTAVIEYMPISADAITRLQALGDPLTNYRLGLQGFLDERDWAAEHGSIAAHAAAGMLESMSAHVRRQAEIVAKYREAVDLLTDGPHGAA